MSQKREDMRRRRKKLILQVIAAGFICLLLLRFDFWTVFAHRSNDRGVISHHQDDQGSKINQKTNNLLREMMGDKMVKNLTPVTECEIPFFKHIPKEENSSEPSACQRKKPTQSSCMLARELFGDPSQKQLDNACAYQKRLEFCKLQQTKSKAYEVTCDITTCDESIYLGTIDILTAEEIWSEFTGHKALEESILNILKTEHAGYCLIRCGGDDGLGDPKHVPHMDEIDPSHSVSQILILPPNVKSNINTETEKSFNFNFVFVDSVSRSHFFRSLPKSVKVLDDIFRRQKSHSDNPLILDFHLVQAVRSRTYESLQALFSGVINPFEKPFGVQAMPKSRLRVKDLITPLREIGYVTQWIEDLCPLWEWGIAKDFLVYNKTLSVAEMWKELKVTLGEVNIDTIGPTLSSCRMLHANAHADPFHGPDRICYNGRHQHDYLLDYLYMFHQEMDKFKKPFFSFYETNIAHESSGLRVQYFDHAFSKYLEYVATLNNTLTVLFSDHGNAYGDFVSESLEGRTEMYNAFMFLIVPSTVQALIGNQSLITITENQHRLISLLDLHYTFKYLIEQLYMKSNVTHQHLTENIVSKVTEFNKQFNVTEKGLFSPVSISRTCSHIPRIMPNLCICEGYDSGSNNYDYNFLLAMFVVGVLNNQIQIERRKHQMNVGEKITGGFGSCHRLVTDTIANIQRSKNDGSETTKMDLYVKSPGQRNSEIFFVAVSTNSVEENQLQLQNFDRITQYSIYSVCADPGVDLSLCICDLDLSKVNATDYKLKVFQNEHYEKLRMTYDDIEVAGVKCLKVIQRSGLYGAVTEAMNSCASPVSIFLEIATENLILSSLDEAVLYPGDITFLVAGIVLDTGKAWNWDISLNVLTSP